MGRARCGMVVREERAWVRAVAGQTRGRVEVQEWPEVLARARRCMMSLGAAIPDARFRYVSTGAETGVMSGVAIRATGRRPDRELCVLLFP
jgi:hypothetical protein